MKIALILLAAGNSRRFGSNKLLHEIDGRPMYLHTLENLAKMAEGWNAKENASQTFNAAGQFSPAKQFSPAEQFSRTETLSERPQKPSLSLTVVTQYETIGEKAKALGAEVLYNPRPWEGISSSLKIGLGANLDADFALFAVADQPRLSEKTLDAVLNLALTSGKGMACAAYHGEYGNPCVFSRKYFPELLALTGDRGGKRILLAHPEDAALYSVSDLAELEDIDTPAQIED